MRRANQIRLGLTIMATCAIAVLAVSVLSAAPNHVLFGKCVNNDNNVCDNCTIWYDAGFNDDCWAQSCDGGASAANLLVCVDSNNGQDSCNPDAGDVEITGCNNCERWECDIQNGSCKQTHGANDCRCPDNIKGDAIDPIHRRVRC